MPVPSSKARVALVQRTIGSVAFEDPYHWLGPDTEEVLAWQWQRDEEARSFVQDWPHFAELKQQVAAAGTSLDWFTHSPPRKRGDLWFWTAPEGQGGNVTLWAGLDPDQGCPLVASACLAPDSEPAADLMIYWFEPSPKGRYVAAICTNAGDMGGVWRVVDVEERRVLEFAAPGTAYSGALPGWLPDESGFYLGERTEDGRHALRFIPVSPGTPTRPSAVFGYDGVSSDVAGITAEVSPDGRRAILLTGPHERRAKLIGDLGQNKWAEFLPAEYSGECSGAWLDSETYIARVHEPRNPRGRVVAIPVGASTNPATWHELIPTSEASLRAAGIVGDNLILCEVLQGGARFRVFDADGTNERIVPLPGPGTTSIAWVHRRFLPSDALAFDYSTFDQRTTRYRFDFGSAMVEAIGSAGRKDLGIVVTRRVATSADGTAVQYFVVHDANTDMSSPHPTLLTGYGGFNVTFLPSHLGPILPFIRAGGVFVHAILRGGGEFGSDWRQQGRLASKWNVFLDLFAVAEALIAEKLTTSSQLAMMGASNGGLLAGAAIVHRPDLFRAVVPVVPTFDEMEPLPPGPEFAAARSIHYGELGDPEDPVMSRILYSYSPYHNVADGVAYPAVFQVFGEKDISCMPFHGRKFTARLQAASSSGLPVFLRVWKNTGHAPTTDEAIVGQPAEWLAFVMKILGMTPQTSAR